MIKEKQEIVEKVAEAISRSTVVFATNYRGMPVWEMNQFRRKLREAGAEYRIVKNTLARLATERVGKEEFKQLLSGPTALMFGYGEVAELAKVLVDYSRESKDTISIKGGLLENRVLTSEEVIALSRLPSREILVARLLGEMRAPISSLVQVLGGCLGGLSRVLQARKQQLEGG